jgi:hypothetical protein
LTYNGCDVELELLHVPLVKELVCHQLGQLKMDILKRKPNDISLFFARSCFEKEPL